MDPLEVRNQEIQKKIKQEQLWNNQLKAVMDNNDMQNPLKYIYKMKKKLEGNDVEQIFTKIFEYVRLGRSDNFYFNEKIIYELARYYNYNIFEPNIKMKALTKFILSNFKFTSLKCYALPFDYKLGYFIIDIINIMIENSINNSKSNFNIYNFFDYEIILNCHSLSLKEYLIKNFDKGIIIYDLLVKYKHEITSKQLTKQKNKLFTHLSIELKIYKFKKNLIIDNQKILENKKNLVIEFKNSFVERIFNFDKIEHFIKLNKSLHQIKNCFNNINYIIKIKKNCCVCLSNENNIYQKHLIICHKSNCKYILCEECFNPFLKNNKCIICRKYM